jgi:hypothetical protein
VRLMLILTVSVAGVMADSLALRLLVDSEGPGEYNQRLLELGSNCPELRPVLVQVDTTIVQRQTSDSCTRTFRVSFWDKTGRLLRRREFSGPGNYGDYFYASVSRDRSRLLTQRGGIQDVTQTYYGGGGEALFTLPDIAVTDIGGRYLRTYFDEDGGGPYSDHSVLFGSAGDSIARIPGSFVRFEAVGGVARDTTIALQADSWIVVCGPAGDIRLQRRCLPTAYLSLSPDGRWLAFATINFVTACDLGTGRTWTDSFADALVFDSLEKAGSRATPPGYFAQPEVAVTAEGRVAVCRRHNYRHEWVEARVYDSAGRVLLPAAEAGPLMITRIGMVGSSLVTAGDGGVMVIEPGRQQRFDVATTQGDEWRMSGRHIAVLGAHRYRLYQLLR